MNGLPHRLGFVREQNMTFSIYEKLCKARIKHGKTPMETPASLEQADQMYAHFWITIKDSQSQSKDATLLWQRLARLYGLC